MVEQSYSTSTLNQNHCRFSKHCQAGERACGLWQGEGDREEEVKGDHSAACKQTFNFIKGAKFLKVSLASREIKCKQVEHAFSALAK